MCNEMIAKKINVSYAKLMETNTLKFKLRKWTNYILINLFLVFLSGCASNIEKRNETSKLSFIAVKKDAKYPHYPSYNIETLKNQSIQVTVWINWKKQTSAEPLDFIAAKHAIDHGYAYITRLDEFHEICIDGCSKFLPSGADFQLSNSIISDESKKVDNIILEYEKMFSISIE